MINKQLEKQKIAALLMSQTSVASLNSTKQANQLAATTTTATTATAAVMLATPLTAPTATFFAPANSTTASTSQAPNWTAQNLKILQNLTPEKQQQLLQQRQALQQLLEKQQAQIKKEALEAINILNATSEPDIQITGVSRQQAKNITSQSSNLPQLLKATPTTNSNLLSSSSSPFALNKSISGSSAPFGSANSSLSGKLLDSKLKTKLTRGKSKNDYSSFGDDEEENIKVASVSLQVRCEYVLLISGYNTIISKINA